jgi:hypothetical protein
MHSDPAAAGSEARAEVRRRPSPQQLAKAAGGRLGLLPIQRVISGMRHRGVPLSELRALEVFGYTGERLTRYYAPLVRSLEIWEIDPRLSGTLRTSFPQADVKIVDSYDEIRRTDNRFDLVVIDNFTTAEEHFRLFPDVFRVVSDDATLVLRTIPHATDLTRRRYPSMFDHDHLAARRAFYEVDTPHAIPLETLASRYGRRAEAAGFRADWHFFVPAREFVGLLPRGLGMLLTLKISRVAGDAPVPGLRAPAPPSSASA